MALQKDMTYMVLNYSGSPVSVLTRHESFLVDRGTRDEPYGIPFPLEDIRMINMNGNAFKIGLLTFEDEFKKDLYEDLRIYNWQDILTDEDIENIIMYPTIEGWKKILAIENDNYFNRVIGVYSGLTSVFSEIPIKSKILIDARKSELLQGIRKTQINLSIINSNTTPTEEVQSLKDENEILKQRLAELESRTVPEPEPETETDTHTETEVTQSKKPVGRPKTKS